jgi:hypothetical protein
MVDGYGQGVPCGVGQLIGGCLGVVAGEGAAHLDLPFVGRVAGQLLPWHRPLQQLQELTQVLLLIGAHGRAS